MPRPSKAAHVLAKLREELGGLYQREFAERVGLHWRTVQDIERRGRISRRNAIKISEKTGVSSDWLLQNDPSLEIKSVSGKRWSNKDRHAFEARSKRWPELAPVIRKWNLAVCFTLLYDYVNLRFLLEGLPNPPEALRKWKACQHGAIVKFLAAYRPASEREKELTRKGGGEWPRLSRESLLTVKDDVDTIFDAAESPEPKDEVAEAVSNALRHGLYDLGEVLEILDGMTERNRQERLLKLYGLKKIG